MGHPTTGILTGGGARCIVKEAKGHRQKMLQSKSALVWQSSGYNGVRVARPSLSSGKDGRSGIQRVGYMRSSAVVQEDAVIARGAELGVEFKPLYKDFGVDVVNMDIEQGISEAEGVLLKDALDCFKLVRFRGQDSSLEKQLEVR